MFTLSYIMKPTYSVESATYSRPLLLNPQLLDHFSEPSVWHSFIPAADGD